MPTTAPAGPAYEQIELALRALPTAPRVLARLALRLRTVDVDVADVAAIVKSDAGLAGVLLASANSAAFCGFDAATTVEDAVARLGYRETYRAIGDAASGLLAHQPLALYQITCRRLRENSLFCALVMEELSHRSALDSGTAYTMGLLRSMGKIVLDRFARDVPAVQPFDPSLEYLLGWERGIAPVSSAEITARALDRWGFPVRAVDAMRQHLRPPPHARDEAHLLHLAASLADRFGFGLPGESAYWRAEDETCDALELDPLRVAEGAERVAETVLHGSPVLA